MVLFQINAVVVNYLFIL